MDMQQTLNTISNFMDAHPNPIAIAMTPQFKDELLNSGTCKTQIGGISYTGVRLYLLDNLPKPYRIYYNQQSLTKDIALYSGIGET